MSKPVNAALARKLSAGQKGLSNTARGMLRALRLGLARSAVERIRLAVSVIGVRHSTRKQETVTQGLGEDWLLLLFSAADHRVAAMALDPGFVSAIIQKQTIGEVFQDPPQPRPFTDTDAAMVAPLVEGSAVRAVEMLEDPIDISRLSGMEFSSRAADLRAVALALVEESYDVFDLTVELEGGIRQGTMSVLLPEAPRPDSSTADAADETTARLSAATAVMRAELMAVIGRLHLPLVELSSLNTGDLLPLTGGRLDEIDILAIDRTRATKGRLGQCGGMRAIRVNERIQAPVVSKGDDVAFVEHDSSRRQNPSREMDLPSDAFDLGDDDLLQPSDMAAAIDHDMADIDTKRIASEISELAGLPAPRGSVDGPKG